jgi:hypothetical protein
LTSYNNSPYKVLTKGIKPKRRNQNVQALGVVVTLLTGLELKADRNSLPGRFPICPSTYPLHPPPFYSTKTPFITSLLCSDKPCRERCLAAALATYSAVGTGFASLLSNTATAERSNQSSETTAATAAASTSWWWGLLVIGWVLHLLEKNGLNPNSASVCQKKLTGGPC